MTRLGLQSVYRALVGLRPGYCQVSVGRLSEFCFTSCHRGGGTNLKLFDYMASGVPIVANTFGARGVAEDGWFVPVNSSGRMREMVTSRLWRSEQARLAARVAHDIAIRYFDWDAIAAITKRCSRDSGHAAQTRVPIFALSIFGRQIRGRARTNDRRAASRDQLEQAAADSDGLTLRAVVIEILVQNIDRIVGADGPSWVLQRAFGLWAGPSGLQERIGMERLPPRARPWQKDILWPLSNAIGQFSPGAQVRLKFGVSISMYW
jgi:hypothetical protein